MSGSHVRARAGDWIAVDWGTTTMRAALVADDGTVRARAPTGPGMSELARDGAGPEGYERALLDAIAPWRADRAVDALVCGMAGAWDGGWERVPYCRVPRSLDDLLGAAKRVVTRDRHLHVRIVPGLSTRTHQPGDVPDVMRGEETQLLGLLQRVPDAGRVCLPGTHAKWARLEGGHVLGFRTHMTGELNALLTRHSVLRSTLGDGEGFDAASFDRAVEVALDARGAVLDRLFAIRAGAMLEHGVGGAQSRAALSGLLIGAEVAREADEPDLVHLVGGGELTALYARALELAGRESERHDGGDLSVAGLAAMRQGER